jgi:hypothetical protein
VDTDLIANQISCLQRYGFTILRGALLAQFGKLESLFNEVLPWEQNQQRTSRQTIFNALGESEWKACYSPDSQLGAVLLGVGAQQMVQDEVNILVGDSTWHRDGRDVPAVAYRAVVYLDAQCSGNGSLMVIPASHNRQHCWVEQSYQFLEDRSAPCRGVSHPWAMELVSQPGDVVVFHCGLTHASFGGTHRRQVAFVFVGDSISADDRDLRTKFVMNRLLAGTQIFGAK